MTNLIEWNDHIEQLIAKLRASKFPCDDDLHIHWIDDRNEAMALSNADPVEIWLPKIRSAADYATALHEIGHVCGRYQRSANVMTREAWAWNWARQNALQWTLGMEQDARFVAMVRRDGAPETKNGQLISRHDDGPKQRSPGHSDYLRSRNRAFEAVHALGTVRGTL